MRWHSLAALALGAGLAFAGPKSASADIISYTLTTANDTSAVGSGPYATVQVNLTSGTTATITFTASSDYSLVDSNIADVNVNAASWTIGTFSSTPSTTISDTGSGNVSTFGVFNQTTKEQNASTLLSTVSFVLTDTGGTWANAASVLTANANGFIAAAHVASAAQCILTPTACTGFVSVPGPLAGTGLPGLIVACGALIALARRRRDGLTHA